MALSAKQRKFLKGQAHAMKPIAYLGQKGVTPAFLLELNKNLEDHELVKVKVACDDQEELETLCNEIKEQCTADVVQVIGHMLILYRKAKAPRIKLPR